MVRIPRPHPGRICSAAPRSCRRIGGSPARVMTRVPATSPRASP